MLISSSKSIKITTSCWPTRQEDAGTHQKDPHVKDKPQGDSRRGAITINSIPARWVTHKLENSNTELVLPLLWRFWTTPQTFQARDPQEIWPWRGFDYRISTRLGKQTAILEDTNEMLPMHQDPEKRSSDPKGELNQNYLLSVGRVSWRDVSQQGLTTGTGALAAAVQEVTPWHKPSWRSPLIQRALTGRKSNPTHQPITVLKLYCARRPCPPQ